MPTLNKSVSDFLNHCQFEKNLSIKTLKAYQTDLLQFDSFLIDSNFPHHISNITKAEIREYIASLANLKPKSVKRKIASIKALFNYLEFEDLLITNPLRKLKIKIKEPRLLPVVLNMSEISKVYKVAFEIEKNIKNRTSYSYKEALRNLVVLELLFTTGARVSEVANLKVHNMNLDTGNIKICGKGAKERIIQICNKETIAVLKKYQRIYSKQIECSGFFLINRFGNKLSDQSIRNIVRNFITTAGIQKNVTPHTFRHSFATLLLERDVDIKYIQSMLGHSSIMTTQIYTHVNSEKQRQILKSKHPRKLLVMSN